MKARVGNIRWGIALLLAVGIIINYFDRVNLSVATNALTNEFHLTDTQIGVILSSYLWSYTLLQIPVGELLDRIGIKWIMRTGTIIWSIASIMTAVVSGFGLIILSRVILGIGESPAFPGSSKATGYWFPIQERGKATTAFDAAAKLSSALGLPIIALIVTAYGWRAGFWVTGVLSLAYAIVFWLLYRNPSESRFLSEKERTYITEGGAQQEGAQTVNAATNLGFLLRQRKIWGLTLSFTAYNYAFNLFLVWLPGYLQKQLHVPVLKSGLYLIIPWLVAAAADVVIGGILVDWLTARSNDPTRVRRILFTIGMLLGTTAIGAYFTSDVNVAITWLTISLAGLAFAAPILWSIPSLVAPRGTVGTVGGIMNSLGNLAGIVAPIVAGIIADQVGFASNFLLTGAILLAGILCFLLLLGSIEQIQAPSADASIAASEKTGATGNV
ncbi:MAG TPA: MFS transporter [Ktedonobacteraceae bacterium]|nr:MFS transporter [Ktedonobacteraceae bacterium]